MSDQLCQACGAHVAAYDLIHYGSNETNYHALCSRCFNAEMARQGDVDFEHVEFQPIDMIDADGASHRFHFLLRLLGDRISLEAFELEHEARSGHQFQVLGDVAADPFALLGQLTERMRRALSRRHLTTEHGRLSIADFIVRGRFEWASESEDGVPLVVIDGQPVTWDRFGRLLMSFEGWQFKLEIRDPSEEI